MRQIAKAELEIKRKIKVIGEAKKNYVPVAEGKISFHLRFEGVLES